MGFVIIALLADLDYHDLLIYQPSRVRDEGSMDRKPLL